MLLAVEGGGFFSSSASGYCKGLTLLLLGQKNEEKPMRVSPWNQYQLVDHEPDPDLQLASKKNRLAQGCASFICFGRAAAGVESSSPLNVGPTQKQDVPPGSLASNKGTGLTDTSIDGSASRKFALKSNLRKPTQTISESVKISHKHEALCGEGSSGSDHIERRTVQWTDTSGGELAEIREFEPSDVGGSDDEFDDEKKGRCSCRIM